MIIGPAGGMPVARAGRPGATVTRRVPLALQEPGQPRPGPRAPARRRRHTGEAGTCPPVVTVFWAATMTVEWLPQPAAAAAAPACRAVPGPVIRAAAAAPSHAAACFRVCRSRSQ